MNLEIEFLFISNTYNVLDLIKHRINREKR